MEEALLSPSPESSSPPAPRRSYKSWRIYLNLSLVLLTATCLVTFGVLLLLPSATPLPAWLGLASSPSLPTFAICIISVSAAAPLLCLAACAVAAAPSQAARKHAAVFADAMLEEIVSGGSLGSLYDVFGAEHAARGTLLLLAGGLGSPRQVLAGFARAAAARSLRVLLVDLPGNGALAGVPFSLVRCERVLLAVLAEHRLVGGGAAAAAPGVAASTVVVAAYSAAAYPAAYFAYLHPHLLSGFVLLGAVPRMTTLTHWRAWLLRLEWVASLYALGMAGRVQAHPRAPAQVKAELGACDWNFATLPDLLSEVRSAPFPLLTSLRRLERPLLVLGPGAWVRRARRILPINWDWARFEPARGIADEILPTLVAAKQRAVAEVLASFVADAVRAMDVKEAERAQAEVRQALAAHAASGEGGAGGGGGPPARGRDGSNSSGGAPSGRGRGGWGSRGGGSSSGKGGSFTVAGHSPASDRSGTSSSALGGGAQAGRYTVVGGGLGGAALATARRSSAGLPRSASAAGSAAGASTVSPAGSLSSLGMGSRGVSPATLPGGAGGHG
jgi:hypothetical protein